MVASIFKMFGRSPIRPLQEHMAKANQCAELLVPFFTAVLDDNWKKAEKIQLKINDTEREADYLKKDLRLHLPKSLFMPVPRSDILELLITQDEVANKSEDITGLMVGRKMQIPAKMAPDLTKFVKRSVDASAQANKAISELDELLETGFSGSEVKLIKDMIKKLDKIEHDTDDMQVKMRRLLFGLENEMPPVDVVFLYKIIEWIGELADLSQQVGGRLQLLLAR